MKGSHEAVDQHQVVHELATVAIYELSSESVLTMKMKKSRLVGVAGRTNGHVKKSTRHPKKHIWKFRRFADSKKYIFGHRLEG